MRARKNPNYTKIIYILYLFKMKKKSSHQVWWVASALIKMHINNNNMSIYASWEFYYK